MNDTLVEVFAREEAEQPCAEQAARERAAIAAWLDESEAATKRNVDATAQPVRR